VTESKTVRRCVVGAGIVMLTISLCGDTASASCVRQQRTAYCASTEVKGTNDNNQKQEEKKDTPKYQLSNYIVPKDENDTSSAITYYLNNPDKVSQEELDAVCMDYLKNTLDMKNLMRVMNSLSTQTVDQMAEYYIKESKDYRMFDDLKSYLSKKASKKLKKVVTKALNAAVDKGKECIDDYIKHPEKYSQEKLEEVVTNYVKENKDITVALKVVDKLGTDAMNQIVTTYLKDTKDWKSLKSLKKYISKDVFNELSKLAKKEIFNIFK